MIVTTGAPVTELDPFFAVIYDGEWNACIGRQGSDENYVDGFMEAALELAEAVIDKRQFEKRDTLAMPILYNARHAVELSLKFAIRQLCQSGFLNALHPKNHDILSHWQMLAAPPHGDRALGELTAALKPYAESLHAIDEEGQQLRYSETQDGEQSLKDKSICNLAHVRRSLELLSEVLHGLKNRSINLAEEHLTGTFTKELSRRDLYSVAEMLPSLDKWGEPAFDDVKAEIRRVFGLSSGKLSNAVDVIKAHREMGSILGRDFELTHLSDAHARAVIAEWSKVHPPRAEEDGDDGVEYFALDLGTVAENREIRSAAVRTVAATLSDEELADLETIFYLGRAAPFSMCENYQRVLNGRLDLIGKRDRNEAFDDILSKTNLLTGLVNGINVLGRRGLASELAALRVDRFIPKI